MSPLATDPLVNLDLRSGAFFLDGAEGAGQPLYGWLHAPAAVTARDTAVLICAPFGWDDTTSYRSRRVWAQRLADAGYPALRFDLPGTGESGGPIDEPDRLESWTAAVVASARWLREAAGCRRLVACGIGLGGLLAARAFAQADAIDDITLWATPARGRSLVRELRTFSRLEASARETAEQAFARSREEVPVHPPLEPGAIQAGGFLLTAAAAAELEDVDLTELAVPGAASRRALLFDRDGIAVDARLNEWLTEVGVEVTSGSGEGYGAMTQQLYEAEAPAAVIGQMIAWLGDPAAANDPPAPDANTHAGVARREDEVELRGDDGDVREQLFHLDAPTGRLEGVLTLPPTGPGTGTGLCAIYTNVGAQRRPGPGRMWVDAARRWAARGVPSLRLDLAGLGDSEGDTARYANIANLYAPEIVDQLGEVVSELSARGVAERFVIVGACSGAYSGFHCALRDTRVRSVVMFNTATLMWDPTLPAAREARKLRKLRNPDQWSRLLLGRVDTQVMMRVAKGAAKSLLMAILGAPKRVSARRFGTQEVRNQIDVALDRLNAQDQRIVLAFCSLGEQLLDELRRDGRLPPNSRWPNMHLELIPGSDHFLRPRDMQQNAHRILDEALAAELVRTPAAVPVGHARPT